MEWKLALFSKCTDYWFYWFYCERFIHLCVLFHFSFSFFYIAIFSQLIVLHIFWWNDRFVQSFSLIKQIFLHPTTILHSNVLPSNQKPMDRTNSLSYCFCYLFIYLIICINQIDVKEEKICHNFHCNFKNQTMFFSRFFKRKPINQPTYFLDMVESMWNRTITHPNSVTEPSQIFHGLGLLITYHSICD